ncbi:MAG: cyanophycinase, partial [Bacteroidota bacterium]|nr:cyanophycinase [Bacteroidota bacterium]
LKRIIDEINDANKYIEVITTASERYPEELGDTYKNVFKDLGADFVDVLDIRNRRDALDPEFEKRLENAAGVLFTGGDQLRLSTILGGTRLLDIIYEKYQNENFIIAGTSAGAMVLSNSMIYHGSSVDSFNKGELKITSGFGFFPGVVIDTHFIKRGRFGRLAQAVSVNPAYTGMGIEEDTALVVSHGNMMEVIGSGNVIIVDGHMIKSSNITDIGDGAPISIDSLLVHVLARGNGYRLSDRKFVTSVRDEENVDRSEINAKEEAEDRIESLAPHTLLRDSKERSSGNGQDRGREREREHGRSREREGRIGREKSSRSSRDEEE